MIGLVASFWVASLITLTQYGWQFNFGARMQGIWPQGTWDNLLGLYLCFMVLWFRWAGASMAERVIYVLTMLMALLMVVLAGGRAPWLALFISLAAYFLLFHRNPKVIVTAAVIAALGVITSVTLFQDRTEQLLNRVTSITQTESDSSNWIRLQLWGIGLSHMGELISNQPLKAVFGSGAKSYDPTQVAFFETMPYEPRARERLVAYGYPTGDTHNNYIDSALRNGLLWTAAMFLYFLWLPTRFSLTQIRANPEPSVLVVYLGIMAMFYTVVPHFMSFFFALIIILLLTREQKSSRQT
jgi:O-antigen ligase